MPPKEAIDIVASPEPQMALTRREMYGVRAAAGLSTTIGATIGPVRGNTFVVASGGLGVPTAAGFPGFAGGAGGASLKYFNAKSETMSCLFDTFAFN